MNEHIDSETLIDYLHRELTPERDAFVHAHLAGCAECARAYDAEARLTERLRSAARAEELELPPSVVARIRSEVALRSHPAWWTQVTSVLRPAVALPTAAVVVLATVLGFSSLQSHFAGAPSIAASYYLDDHDALSSSSLPFAQTAVVPEALDPGSTSEASRIAPNVIASE